MIDTQNTEDASPRRDHYVKAGDTPALGMPVEPGSGGKRRAHTLGIDVAATAEITVGDDVLWHDREATVAEVYPAGQAWLRVLCKIEFEDGGPSVVVGRDELELIQDDGTRYFVARPDLTDTAPLPSPVPRMAKASLSNGSTEVAASLLEETAELPRTGDIELDDDGLAALAEATLATLADPWSEESPAQTLPAVDVARRIGAFEGVWLALVDVLRVIAAFLVWPFTRDGARALLARVVDAVAEFVDLEADRQHDWQHAHALLIAKILVALISGLILGGLAVAWVVLG